MPSRFFKIIIVNNSGQTLTYNNNGRINLKIGGASISAARKSIVTSLTDDACGFTTGGSLADGAEILSAVEYDNTSVGYLGYQVQLEITHDEGAAADGTFDLYVSGGDATGELVSDASGYDSAELNKLRQIGSLTWHASGVDDEVMRSEVLSI